MDLTITDYLWFAGGLAGAVFIAWLRHKIFLHRLGKVGEAHQGKIEEINAQWASLHSHHDDIWNDCDFGALVPKKPVLNAVNVLRIPDNERYEVYITVQPNNGETVEELFEGALDTENAIYLTLGNAEGAYYSEDGYMAGAWSDESLIWGISIRDLQRNTEDVSNKRNYPPQADLRRVWEQVARNVKLSSSEQSLKAVQTSLDESKARLQANSTEDEDA